MMEPALLAAVSAIHASPAVAVIAATGGASQARSVLSVWNLGMAVCGRQASLRASSGFASFSALQAVGWLLGVPGASRTVLEAVAPYSRRSFMDFVRRSCQSLRPLSPPERYVSASSAALLAQAAYNRALVLSPPGRPVVGVACTCALATSATKKGSHRCHVAARSQSQLLQYSLHLGKASGRSRWQEDELSSRLLIKALADASLGPSAEQLSFFPPAEAAVLFRSPVPGSSTSGMGGNGDSSLGREGGMGWAGEDSVRKEATAYTRLQQLQEVLDGVVPMCVFSGNGESKGIEEANELGCHAALHSAAQDCPPKFATDGRRVVLSGSFNPLHHGHTSLMEAALRIVPDGVPCYEIPALNADKGQIPVEELERRVLQFVGRGDMVVVTGAPLFATKAALLPDSSFVVGYDTAIRLINPKYYGDSPKRMEEVLLGMGEQGCNFIVAPRLVASDLRTFDDLQIPPALSQLFSGIPDFRVDISSTEIRQQIRMGHGGNAAS